jgi:hypothetical protein
LADLLRKTGHENLLFTAKDTAILKEIVEILQPFSEVFAFCTSLFFVVVLELFVI